MKPRAKVLCLCRGSVQDGLGHVTRSRAVAQALAAEASVRFVVIGDGCSDALLEGRGLDFRSVRSEQEAMAQAEDFAPDMVLLDLLHMEPARCRGLAQRATTISLSPIFNGLAEVDLLFHRTARVRPEWRNCGRLEVRAGLRYSVVSPHSTPIPREIYLHHLEPERLSLAVSMGGTDAANRTIRVLETFKAARRRWLIWVLFGEGYAHSYQAIVDLMKGSPHEIILAKTNDSMWRILRTCSLAVLAAGTTTYEAAHVGLPSVNLLLDARNYYLIQELVEAGACHGMAEDFDTTLASLNDRLAALDEDRATLALMHDRARTLIDGLGARRIAEEALAFHSTRRTS